MAVKKALQVLMRPAWLTACERSGSYSDSTAACVRGVCGPQAGRVLRIPLNFRRAAHMTFHEHARGDTAEWHGRGEEQRLPRHELLWGTHVRDDFFLRLAGTAGQARQGQGRAHELQEAAATHRIMANGVGELACQQRLPRLAVCQFLQATPEGWAMCGGETLPQGDKIDGRRR